MEPFGTTQWEDSTSLCSDSDQTPASSIVGFDIRDKNVNIKKNLNQAYNIILLWFW